MLIDHAVEKRQQKKALAASSCTLKSVPAKEARFVRVGEGARWVDEKEGQLEGEWERKVSGEGWEDEKKEMEVEGRDGRQERPGVGLPRYSQVMRET